MHCCKCIVNSFLLTSLVGPEPRPNGLAECGFSVTNLGNLGRIGVEGTHVPAGRSHVAEGHSWGPKAPPAREASVPAPQGLEGEPRSGSNF